MKSAGKAYTWKETEYKEPWHKRVDIHRFFKDGGEKSTFKDAVKAYYWVEGLVSQIIKDDNSEES